MPYAITIRPGSGEIYAVILKTVRNEIDINAIGAIVSTISESRSSELIIRLSKGDYKKEVLEEALTHTLGARAVVR